MTVVGVYMRKNGGCRHFRYLNLATKAYYPPPPPRTLSVTQRDAAVEGVAAGINV